jgi:methionyl-tRNA formyltransferase
MGTDKFAVPILQAVINSEVELVCVITQPDRPRGRKLKTFPSPVKEVALENNLSILQPRRVRNREFIEDILKAQNPDIIIVAAFGQILPKAVIDLPPHGCINLHPSLLPKYRGAAPIQRTIMNGEEETGVTVMFMDEGEDTGDIIIQEKMAIEMSDSSETLSQKLANMSARLIQKILQLAQVGTLPRRPQDHSKASFAPKLEKEDGRIDWEKGALEIHNLIRGTIPWPGAYTTFGDAINLKIWESCPLESFHANMRPGTIADILPDAGLAIATGDRDLLITTVQPANKSRMRIRDFVNGYRIKSGDTFS